MAIFKVKCCSNTEIRQNCSENRSQHSLVKLIVLCSIVPFTMDGVDSPPQAVLVILKVLSKTHFEKICDFTYPRDIYFLTFSTSPPLRDRNYPRCPTFRCTLVCYPLYSCNPVRRSFTSSRFHDTKFKTIFTDVFYPWCSCVMHLTFWIIHVTNTDLHVNRFVRVER